MTKEQFQELLKRYRAGNCSPEEINKVDEWFASISNEGLELHGTDKAQTHHRILSAIRQTLPAPGPKSIRSDRFLAMKIAAGVTIFIVAGYFLLSNRALPLSSSQGSSSDDMLKFSNATAGILTLTLPDASVIELRPKAEVSYAKSWNGDKREVHLSGEAFFEVVKDIKRPFYVYGGSVVTKVLGTSFTVHALPMAESVQVAVHTGKVSVYERTAGSTAIQRGLASSGVVLSPNEKVEYFVKGKHWVTGLVADPKPLPESNKAVEFVFNDTPLPEVVRRIERAYSIDIVTENDLSASCTFTGDVSMMDLYDLLEVICKSTGTNYDVKGTKILVTGKGCE